MATLKFTPRSEFRQSVELSVTMIHTLLDRVTNPESEYTSQFYGREIVMHLERIIDILNRTLGQPELTAKIQPKMTPTVHPLEVDAIIRELKFVVGACYDPALLAPAPDVVQTGINTLQRAHAVLTARVTKIMSTWIKPDARKQNQAA